jgi:uncharacterized NAD(P)/FAD-binding protein YdhS
VTTFPRSPARLGSPGGRGPVVAIVGGGASGTLAAVHLLRAAATQHCPLRIALIDRHGRHGHVARYWEIHRHRMPPATAQHLTRLRSTGQLSVRRGRVSAVTERGGLLRVRVNQDGTTAELTAGWLVNGTGPGTDITATTDPLLRDLLGRGLARPDPHRLGIDADPAGAVLGSAGTPSRSLFTLGPTLRGLRYETTAIPEIRDQAAALATQLTAAIAARYRPGSAA